MRFSLILRVVPVAALIALAGCSYLIPEDPSEPRYNDVLGPPRAPELNRGMGGGGAMAPSSMNDSAPMAGDFPPVDPQTQALAQQQLAQESAPGFWQSTPQAANDGRRVPQENAMDGSYPALTAVPPAPPMSGPDSTSARLAGVRSELEQDRAYSMQASEQLRRDAAAEPSLLSQMPPSYGTAPAPEPVMAAPLPPPAAVPMEFSAAPPSAPGYIALPPPPPPLMAAPAPYSAPAAVAIVPMNPAPAPFAAAQPAYAAPAVEPIILRSPPPAAPAFATTPYRAPAPAASMPTAIPGGFDPMAGTSAPAYSSSGSLSTSGYLPNSRYTQRRY